MPQYAQNTSVASDKTRTEIERTLKRYGATGFMYGWQGDMATIAFEMRNRHIRFILPLPSKHDAKFLYTSARQLRRTDEQVEEVYEQAIRQRWRALSLVIKAKLEAVEAGITTLEQEFLAHIQLPNGQSVGDFIIPQIASSYESGAMPPLLPAPRHE